MCYGISFSAHKFGSKIVFAMLFRARSDDQINSHLLKIFSVDPIVAINLFKANMLLTLYGIKT